MKRKSARQQTGEEDPGPSKKPKRHFNAIEFKKELKDRCTAIPALEKFNKLVTEDDSGQDVVDSFLKISGECNEIFSLLEGPKLPTTEIRIIFEALECILVTIASDLRHHKAVSVHIVQRILQNHQKQLYGALNTRCTNRYIKSCLRLLTAMVTQDVSMAREVQNMFNFQLEGLIWIMNKRDSTGKEEDVRICFIRFAMSFLITGDDQVIQKLIEVKGFLNGIFRDISKDRASSIHLLLTTLKEKIVCNTAISKTSKMRLFSENTLHSLAALYKWKGICDIKLDQDEEMDEEQRQSAGQNIIRQLVHDFLLTLTCSFKHGINFYDRSIGTSGRVHNNILLKFLLSLKSATEDSLVEELLIRILTACPDLLHKYLTGCDYMFSPRLSDKWLANMELLMKIYENQPEVPPSFQVPDMVTIPKLVTMTLVTTVPVVATRTSLCQGIKNASRLVQFKTLSLISLILKKVGKAVKAIESSESVKMRVIYSEDQVTQFKVLYKEAVCKILPEISFILLCWHKLSRPKKTANQEAKTSEDTDTVETEDARGVAMETDDYRSTEQGQSSSKQEDSKESQFPSPSIASFKVHFLQVLCSCQETLPEAFSQCSYDFSRLLHGIVGSVEAADQSEDRDHAALQYFLLRLLLHSSAGKFRWFKEVKGQGSGMYNLLQLLVNSKHLELKNTTRQLIHKILLETGLFEHTQQEISIWLSNLERVNKENSTALIELFEKLLTKAVRNPYPLADQIIDIVYEATTKQSGEMVDDDNQSVGPRGLEAILNMDVAMETPGSTGGAKSEESFKSTAWSTESFPFSTLVVATLQDWISDNQLYKSASTDKFVHRVLREILHCQANPAPLCLLVGQIFTQSNKEESSTTPKPSKQQKEFLKYCKMFLPEGKKLTDSTKKKKSEKSPHKNKGVECQTFADLLYESFIPDPAAILDVNNEELAQSIVAMETDDIPHAVKHVLLYAKSMVGQSLTKDTNIRQIFKAYMSILDQLYQQAVKNAEHNPPAADEDMDFVEGETCNQSEDITFSVPDINKLSKTCVQKDVPQHVVEIILTHPLCLEWFLPIDTLALKGSAETRWLTQTVVEFVQHILEDSLSCSHISSELIKPYRERTFDFLNVKLSKLAKKQSETPSKTAKREIIIESSFKLLSLLRKFASESSVRELLNKFLQLPQTMIISVSDEEPKLTQVGEALITLLNSHTPDQQTFVRLVNVMQASQFSTLDGAVLDIIKEDPQLVLYTSPETLQYCLEKPTEIRINLAKLLLTHSLAHHLQFIQWSQNKSSLKLINANKEIYLPAVEVFLKKEKHGQGPDVSSSVVKLHKVYHEWLRSWLLESHEGDNLEEDDVKFSTWCEFLHLNDVGILTDILADLHKSIGTENKIWTRYQVQAGLNIIKSIKSSEDFEKSQDLKMAYITDCLRCLCILHKPEKLDIQLESLLHDILVNLLSTVESLTTDKDFAPVWNRFVKTGLRRKYESKMYLQTLTSLVLKVYDSSGLPKLEGVIHLPTIYQMLVSHSLFLSVMLTTDSQENEEKKAEVKETLVELMITMAKLNPTCCDTAHFAVLLGAYGATLSRTDKLLLCLMNIYENNEADMWEYRPYIWGPSGLDQHTKRKKFGRSLWNEPSLRDVLNLLDKDKMHQTVMKFPVKRRLVPSYHDNKSDNLPIYDPCFLLPLFSHLLTPESVVDCRRFVEWHGLGVAIATLSSNDSLMRAAGFYIIRSFYSHLEGARFQEKRQILYLLNCLKNSITEPNTRLSSVMVIFMAKAAQIFFDAEDAMYSMVHKFLLIKPEFNLLLVPQFQRLLFSSDIEYKLQHDWILQLCESGLKDQYDYYIYSKKCFVFKLLMAFFGSPTCSKSTKQRILRILEAAVAIRGGAVDLSRFQGLLPWLHGHIASCDGDLIEEMVSVLSKFWITVSAPKTKYVKVDSDGSKGTTKKESIVSLRTIIEVLQILVATLKKISDRISPTFMHALVVLIDSVIQYRNQKYGQSIADRAFTTQHFILCLYKYGETFLDSNITNNLNPNQTSSGSADGVKKERRSEKRRNKEIEDDHKNQEDAEDSADLQKKCLHHLLEIIFCLGSQEYHNLAPGQLLFVIHWALQETLETPRVDSEKIFRLVKWVHKLVRSAHTLNMVMQEDALRGIVKALLRIYLTCNETALLETGNNYGRIIEEKADTRLPNAAGTEEISEKESNKRESANLSKYVNMQAELNALFAHLSKYCLLSENSKRFPEFRSIAEKAVYKEGVEDLCSGRYGTEETELQRRSELLALLVQELWTESECPAHFHLAQRTLQGLSGKKFKPEKLLQKTGNENKKTTQTKSDSMTKKMS
ncbi:nucleolar pre-ribosomal-associated protein 1-like [Ptychodera flava]|uniref:nucleolar pre-ribosomal-associated protein 1-like n=1 Tax=Ptychodera flava TaxID=63121 RepID=UPI00396A37D5